MWTYALELAHALAQQGALDRLDAVAVHGFPLDWNHWQINAWPDKPEEIQRVTHLGVSSFGAEEPNSAPA